MDGLDRGHDLADRLLKDRKVVALDEKLEDRVRHAKRDDSRVGNRCGNIREPPLESVGTHPPSDLLRDFRPDILCFCDHGFNNSPPPHDISVPRENQFCRFFSRGKVLIWEAGREKGFKSFVLK